MSASRNNIPPPLAPLSPPKPHTYDPTQCTVESTPPQNPASYQPMDFTTTFTSPLDSTTNNSTPHPPTNPRPNTASDHSIDFTTTFTDRTTDSSRSNPPSALATLLNLSRNISPTPTATTPPADTIATHAQLGPLLVEAEKAFWHINEKLQVYYSGMVNAQIECKEKDVKIAQLEGRARGWEEEVGRLRAEVEMLKGGKGESEAERGMGGYGGGI